MSSRVTEYAFADNVVRTNTDQPERLSFVTDVQIPADLLPRDGRFGAGPSKIQTSHLDALAPAE